MPEEPAYEINQKGRTARKRWYLPVLGLLVMRRTLKHQTIHMSSSTSCKALNLVGLLMIITKVARRQCGSSIH